jgi:hypothetical protein
VRTILLPTALLALSASAQAPPQPPAGSNWQHVQALPAGTSIEVKARTSHASCTLKSVAPDSLTCAHHKDLVFQRADILTIKVSHRDRSALVGAAVAGGTLAVVGFAATTDHAPNSLFGSNFLRGPVTLGLGLGGGIIGAAVGAFTDFTRSTVYKAP